MFLLLSYLSLTLMTATLTVLLVVVVTRGALGIVGVPQNTALRVSARLVNEILSG